MMISSILGSQKIVFVINKMDTIEWSEERFNNIKNTIEKYAKESAFPFDVKKFYWVPVSGIN
jgi:translation elongation factor EF-1alpha